MMSNQPPGRPPCATCHKAGGGTCTCGIGPWCNGCKICFTCGRYDFGLPFIANGITNPYRTAQHEWEIWSDFDAGIDKPTETVSDCYCRDHPNGVWHTVNSHNYRQHVPYCKGCVELGRYPEKMVRNELMEVLEGLL